MANVSSLCTSMPLSLLLRFSLSRTVYYVVISECLVFAMFAHVCTCLCSPVMWHVYFFAILCCLLCSTMVLDEPCLISLCTVSVYLYMVEMTVKPT